MKTILIIEDDSGIQDMLKIFLTGKGFNVLSAYSGTEGLLVHGRDVDLILLDLMLPGRSGSEIIEDLRKIKDVPVIVMSAVGDIGSKIDLFGKGADDYITKPFHNEELLARINARFREHTSEDSEISIDGLVIKTDEHVVCLNGEEVPFSRYEYDIVLILARNCGMIVTKSTLFDRVWDYAAEADENTLNVHMSRIRKKLKDIDPEAEYIETVRGVGYRMKKAQDPLRKI